MLSSENVMSAAIQAPVFPHTTRSQIEAFLSQKRIAIVGVSRDPRDFTRMLFRDFQKRGYDAVAVNPAVADVDGAKCYANVREVPNVSAALLMTPAEATPAVVEDCIAAGIRQVWMYRATGRGAVDESAVERCREQGIDVIAGECPFMFFPKTGFPHNVHGLLRKIFGSYPA